MISNMERMGFVKKLFSALFVAAVVIGLGVVGCTSTTTAPPSTTKTATTSTDSGTKTISGKFVSYKDGELKYKDDKDKDQSTKTDVKPMIDGTEGKWDDVKADAKITVTEKDSKVTKVEVKTK